VLAVEGVEVEPYEDVVEYGKRNFAPNSSNNTFDMKDHIFITDVLGSVMISSGFQWLPISLNKKCQLLPPQFLLLFDSSANLPWLVWLKC
jgi:hypothetical protein